MDCEIHGCRRRRRFGIDFHCKSSATTRFMHQTGGRVNHRGRTHRDKQVAGRGAKGGTQVIASKRLSKPDDSGARQPSAMGTSRWQGRERNAFVAPRGRASPTLFPARKLPYRPVDPHEGTRAGANVQVVDVLREHLTPWPERPCSDDVMRRVRPTGHNQFTSPRVPLPHQERIVRKRLRRREILRAMIAPQSSWSPERRHTARRRNSRAGEDRESLRLFDAPGQCVEIAAHTASVNPLIADRSTRRSSRAETPDGWPGPLHRRRAR
jgi:hypothetical protein